MIDAYSPPEIARRVREAGVTEANADSLSVLVLAVPAGAFISLGALLFTFVMTSIANWFFLPYAIALDGFGDASLISGAAVNLLMLTLGNVVGGSVLVAGVYWVAYLRSE